MIFGKVERRRTERTSSESLTKRAKIVALWRVLTQSPVARRWGNCGWRNYLKLIFVYRYIFHRHVERSVSAVETSRRSRIKASPVGEAS